MKLKTGSLIEPWFLLDAVSFKKSNSIEFYWLELGRRFSNFFVTPPVKKCFSDKFNQ